MDNRNKLKKIGIYRNIPDIDVDKQPEDKYNRVNYNKGIYPTEFKDKLKLVGVFRRYLGFITELNHDYKSENENFIVVSGKKKYIHEAITVYFCDSACKQSNVNIIGIQRAVELVPKEEYKNVGEAINEIEDAYSDHIIFGQSISIEKIKKITNNEKFFSTRLFFYLKTLNDIAKVILEGNIRDDNVKEWVNYINSYGCLCSPDCEKYFDICSKRKFKNSEGKEVPFTLHLKPVTERKKDDSETSETYTISGDDDNSTCRIYFKWEKEKSNFLVGGIEKHPPTCYDCDETSCQLIKTPWQIVR